MVSCNTYAILAANIFLLLYVALHISKLIPDVIILAQVPSYQYTYTLRRFVPRGRRFEKNYFCRYFRFMKPVKVYVLSKWMVMRIIIYSTQRSFCFVNGLV